MSRARAYLDWNATAPIRPEARTAMIAAMEILGNPSSVHAEGRAARAVVERARFLIAESCGCDTTDIVFTSGSTESAALALADRNIRSALIEHESVLAWTRPDLDTDACGMVAVGLPGECTLQLANGETGIIQDLPDGIYATDATQAFGKVPVTRGIRKSAVAMLSAHKIGGPKGVGALVIRPGLDLEPRLKGGGQELGRRSGTENVMGIAGFGAAAAAASRELAEGVWERVTMLRDLFESALKDAVRGVILIGESSPRLPNTSCFAVEGWKSETQVMQMDLAGFAVSAGSACSSGKVASSAVLEAMGIRPEVAKCAVRVSIGPSTTEDQVLRFAETWAKQCRRLFADRAKRQNVSQKMKGFAA